MQLIQLLTGIDSIVGTPDAADEADKLEGKTTLTTDFEVSHGTPEKSSILCVEGFNEPSVTAKLTSIFFSGGIHIREQFPQIPNLGSD